MSSALAMNTETEIENTMMYEIIIRAAAFTRLVNIIIDFKKTSSSFNNEFHRIKELDNIYAYFFLMSFITMQLIEFFIWRNLKSGKN